MKRKLFVEYFKRRFLSCHWKCHEICKIGTSDKFLCGYVLISLCMCKAS